MVDFPSPKHANQLYALRRRHKKTQSHYWAEATPIRLRYIPDSAPNRQGTAPTRHLKYDTAVAYNLQNAGFFIQKLMNSKQCSRRHHKEREAAMQQQTKDDGSEIYLIRCEIFLIRRRFGRDWHRFGANNAIWGPCVTFKMLGFSFKTM